MKNLFTILLALAFSSNVFANTTTTETKQTIEKKVEVEDTKAVDAVEAKATEAVEAVKEEEKK